MVGGIHLEHVEIRSRYEFVFRGQEEGMQIVDELGHICHRHFVGMAIEGVEGERGHQRIAHRGGLAKKMRARHLGSRAMPGAPLVHDEFYAVLPVHFSHGRPMVANERLHSQRLAEQFVKVLGGEIERIAFARSPAVIMQRPTIDGAENALVALSHSGEKFAGPIQVASVWP